MSLNDKENNKINENEDKIIKNNINNNINNNNIKNDTISYKKDLWMYYDSINSKFIKDREKAKTLMYIISQKSMLSEEYANNLELLYNQFFIELSYFMEEEKNKKNENKKYTLDNILNSFLENIKKESTLFKDYSISIKNKFVIFIHYIIMLIKLQYQMHTDLNDFHKTYESKFKQVLQNINDYKEEYEKAGKLVEDSKKKYEIMKEEIEKNKDKNENENLRYKKCKEENKQRIKEAKEKQKKYEDYIIIANKEREKYIELSEKVYDLSQKLDNEYIELIKNNLTDLLKAKSELFKIIFEENQKMLENTKLIDFNYEMEKFANSKFPKFELPKPFVYEQYTPYLYLRERNKIDLNINRKEVYKIIIHDINHLFSSDKYSLNNIDNNMNNEDINNKEKNKNNKNVTINDMDYIRDVVHEAWNSKKLDIKKINNLLKKEELRLIFLRELNQYRHEGVFLLNNISYDNLTNIFNIILNISKKQKDYESIKTCMILSQTFYKSISNKNVLLQKEVMKNEIWKNKKLWEEMIDYSIKEEINNKKDYLLFLEETEEKREERVKNAVNSVLITFSYNMNLINIPKKERKEIIDLFISKYNLEDNIIIPDDIDVNEIEEEIITESMASNLDIHPNKDKK